MITDNDLKKILAALTGAVATKKDLKQFATKKDLDIEINGLATKEDLRKQTERIDEKLTAFRSDILSHVDANMKEILAVREEQTMHTHSHMRQDEKYEDHEKRIKKLETVSVAP